ncbi:DUF488 family protein [Microbacterium sp. AZCO]|uniref:DUF488 domain-containing protein n=1 Tax=Microbacterium sp. AZCO TaxID=3142976 RepID=UPI0031F34565
MEIRLKRVYDDASPDDGFRVLVDRLWPRGVSKERAAIDLWAKEAAPTTELRRAFHQDGMDWDTFAAAYRAELATNPAVPALRTALADQDVVTLLYGAHDERHNHADLLREALLD